MRTFEGSMHPHSGDRLVVLVEGQEEEGYALARLEVSTSKRVLEAPVSVHALCSVEVDLPEIGPVIGVVTFESNSRGVVYETRAVPIPATDDVSHLRSSQVPLVYASLTQMLTSLEL
jgi:hypothetical protein